MTLYHKAKQFYQEGDLISAKQCLLDITNDDKIEKNPKVLERLGDICLRLNELKDAKTYYRQSMKCITTDNGNTTPNINPSYLKYANLLQYHLQRYNEAQIVYLKLIKTDKYNDRVYYHYAKLLTKIKQYECSRKHWLQCIEFKPTTPHYHYEYALSLKEQNDPKYYAEINTSFEKAVQLTNYHDTHILHQYASFLIHCMQQKEKGAKYMQLAAVFEHQNTVNHTQRSAIKTPPIQTVAKQKPETLKNGNKRHKKKTVLKVKVKNNGRAYTSVKYVVYDFNQTITLTNIYDALKNDTLYTIKDEEFARIFGWRDRIRRLAKHFELLLSNDIKLICLCKDIGLVRGILHKAYLSSYFTDIVEMDTNNEIADKLCYIGHLKGKYDLKYCELLYIDDDSGAISGISSDCFTVLISSGRGITLRDFEYIEYNMNIPTTCYAVFRSDLTSSIISAHSDLYYELKAQIVRSRYDEPIDKLDIILRLKHSNIAHLSGFLEFAEKFRMLCYVSSKFDMWTAMEIIKPLLALQPLDTELNTRNATYISSLGLMVEAEEAFKSCMRGRYITSYVQYGYFLIKLKRRSEAAAVFRSALRINPISIKSLIAMGRICNWLGNNDKAEYYFKKCVSVDPAYDLGRCRYGTFLYEMGRFEEAKKQLGIAVKLWPYSDKSYYMLALTCLNGLNDMDGVKYNLEQCLSINPSHSHAQSRYSQHFGHRYKVKKEIKKAYALNGYQRSRDKGRMPEKGTEKEFEIFWYHTLEGWKIDDIFQKYYKLFKRKKMNKMKLLFKMNKNKLSKVIQIKNKDHIQIIMKSIHNLNKEKKKFKLWLSTIVHNKRLLNEYCNALENNNRTPIYSIQSFYRGISSLSKLRAVLGHKHNKLVIAIWEDYDNTFNK